MVPICGNQALIVVDVRDLEELLDVLISSPAHSMDRRAKSWLLPVRFRSAITLTPYKDEESDIHLDLLYADRLEGMAFSVCVFHPPM